MADDFWQALGGFGNALTAIPKGLDIGMQPMVTLGNIQKQDLANEASGIKNRDEELLQLGREGQQVPSYYGDLTMGKQTGFQLDTAKNQLGIDTNQQQLLFNEALRSPEAQAELSQFPVGSTEYNNALARIQSRYNPMANPDFYTKQILPAEARGGNEQVATEYLRASAARMIDPATQQPYGPDVRVERLPSGGYQVYTADGTPINMGQIELTTAQQMTGNAGPYNALALRQKNSRDQQVANVKMIDDTIIAMKDKAGADPTSNAYVKFSSDASQKIKANDLMRQKINQVPYWDDPTEKDRRLAELDADDAEQRNTILYYRSQVEQRAGPRGQSSGGYGGTGARYPVQGSAGMYPGGTARSLMLNGAQGRGPAAVGPPIIMNNGVRVPQGGPRAGPPGAPPQQGAPTPGTQVISGPSLAANEMPYGYVPPYYGPGRTAGFPTPVDYPQEQVNLPPAYQWQGFPQAPIGGTNPPVFYNPWAPRG